MRSCGRTSEKKNCEAELRAELARFATKEDLERFATKEELRGVRDDLRTQMMMLFEDLKSTMHARFDGVTARLDAMEARIPPVLADHERRIGGVETRVTVLESRRRKRQ